MQIIADIAILFMLLMLAACDRFNATNKYEKNYNDQLEIMESQINKLNNAVDKLDKKYVDQDLEILKLKLDKLYGGMAEFTPDSKDFQAITTTVGIFYIKIKNIEKYANGYKVIFSIGNPNNADYSNIKIDLQYGHSYDEKATLEEKIKWRNSLKANSTTVTKSVLSGQWSDIGVILAPANENDIGYISIRIEPQQVQLKSDFRNPE